MKNAIVFVADANYQRYLDYMAYQTNFSGFDRFVISTSDIKVPYGLTQLDCGKFLVDIGIDGKYSPNNHLTNALLKLAIPYMPALREYDKILYLDLDLQLLPGWTDIFKYTGNKFISACSDPGIIPTSKIDVLKYYENRNFSYANTGVMLFNMSRISEYPEKSQLASIVQFAESHNFVYADQDILNYLNLIDCGLPLQFNCFRWLKDRIKDVRVIHYTAEVGIKEKFDSLISCHTGIGCKVHFLICNYNGQHENHALEKSLDALGRLKLPNIYYHIYDNASSDGSVAVINKYVELGLIDTCLLSKQNRGKAFALNRLYEYSSVSYDIADDDIIISMDSDIILREYDFIDKLCQLFTMSNIGYLGFNLYEDYNCQTISPYTVQSKYRETKMLFEHEYAVVDKVSGLAGGILAIRNKLFQSIKYNENLGKDKTPAVYGGDDAVLTLKLFKSGQPGLYDLSSKIVHYPHNADYNKWKSDVMNNMMDHGFGNSSLPEKGFYD